MPRQTLDVTPGAGDTGAAGGGILNGNIALDELLQDATGITDGAANIEAAGADPAEGARAWTATDTLRSIARKHEARLDNETTVRTSGDSQSTSVPLGTDGMNFDIDANVDAVIGTSYIESTAGAIAAMYPATNLLFSIEITRSAQSGIGAPRVPGYLLTRTLTAHDTTNQEPLVWVSTVHNAVISEWQLVSPVYGLTQNVRSRQSIAESSDWLTLIQSGYYAISYGIGGLGSTLPYSAVAIDWSIQIETVDPTNGYVIAKANYDDGSGARDHAFIAKLTQSGGAWLAPSDWRGLLGGDIESGAVTQESLLSTDWTLTPPAAFTGVFPGVPRMSRNGWSCTVNAYSQITAPTGVGTYYVDGQLGDDTDPGTQSEPFATVEHAMSQPDFGTVFVAPGVYGLVGGWMDATNPGLTGSITTAADGSYAVKRWAIRTGDVYITSDQRTSAWVADGTYPDIYTCGVQFLAGVVDLGHREEGGGFRNYTEVGSTLLCNGLPGSYYYDGATTVYVHPLSGGKPTTDILCLRAESAAGEVGSTRDVYAVGLTFIGGDRGIRHQNNTGGSGGSLVLSQCKSVNCVSAGMWVRSLDSSFVEDCDFSHNGIDGIQYYDNLGYLPVAVEVNCTMNRNGGASGGLDTINGSSCHDGVRCMRINGRAEMNTGPQFADVGTSSSWNVGCVAGRSGAISDNTQNAGFQTTNTATMYLYDCEAVKSAYGIVEAGTDIFIHHTRSITNTGSPTPYTQR